MVTSEELCVSRNLFRCCHTLGIHSTILMRSLFFELLSTSASTSFLLRYLPRNPLTGSMWFAHRTHLKLWCSCRLVVEQVAWFIVPMMYGLQNGKYSFISHLYVKLEFICSSSEIIIKTASLFVSLTTSGTWHWGIHWRPLPVNRHDVDYPEW